MSDAQKVMRDVMRRHRIGWYGNHDRRCFGCPGTSFVDSDEAEAHIVAEIDKALGGLTRQWAVRHPDGVATWPSAGLPSAETLERARLFTDREIVIGWVSGWTSVG